MLRGQKVYGIMLSSCDSKLLVFGGKQFTILTVKDLGEDLIIDNDKEAIICDDWLHSGVWISHNKVALLTAHNVVQVSTVDSTSFVDHATFQWLTLLKNSYIIIMHYCF